MKEESLELKRPAEGAVSWILIIRSLVRPESEFCAHSYEQGQRSDLGL